MRRWLAVCVFMNGVCAQALPSSGLTRALEHALAQRYPRAQIQILDLPPPRAGALSPDPHSLQLLTDNGEEICFRYTAGSQVHRGKARYLARVNAYLARQRILPGAALDPDSFEVRPIVVSKGPHRGYHEWLVQVGETPLEQLEAKQQLMPQQVLLQVAVAPVVAVRRGELVRVDLLTGGITLTTTATTLESAALNTAVHVRTLKEKRELLGRVRHSGVVEVRL